MERLDLLASDARVADFIGRGSEQQHLKQLLTTGPKYRRNKWFSLFRRKQLPVGHAAVILGIGGIGKTTLARKLALSKSLRAKYSGGIYLWEMGGLNRPRKQQDTEDDTKAALRTIITAILPNKNVSMDVSLSGLTAEYNRILSLNKYLVMVDNANFSVNMELLRPPAGSGLLIITRPGHPNLGFLTREYQVELHPFHNSDSIQLLRNRAASRQIDDNIAQRICAACGHLPLAVYAAGTYLGSLYSSHISPEEYANQLDAEISRDLPSSTRLFQLIGQQGVERDIPKTFQLSYRLLSPASKQLFPLLCVFPFQFDESAALAVEQAIHTSPMVSPQLNELHSYGLIEYNADGKRYFLFDLLRFYANNLLQLHPEQFQKVKEAFIDHYFNIVQRLATARSEGNMNTGIEKLYDDLPHFRAIFRLLVGSDIYHPTDLIRVRKFVTNVFTIVPPDTQEPVLKETNWFTQAEIQEWLTAGIATHQPAYDKLSQLEQQFFARLAVFRCPFDAETALAVTNLTLTKPLDSLCQNDLLVKMENSDLYDLPDLCRRLAKTCLSASEFEATQTRYADYTIAKAEAIAKSYTNRDVDVAFTMLQTQQIHITIIAEWAIGSEVNKVQDLQRLEKLLKAIYVYRLYGFSRQQLIIWHQAWFNAYPLSSPSILAKGLAAQRLAWLVEYVDHGAKYAAEIKNLYEFARSVADSYRDKRLECDALVGLATLARHQGRLTEAVNYARTAASIFPGDVTVIAALGTIYEANNQLEDAQKTYKQALELSLSEKEQFNIRVFNSHLSKLAEKNGNLNDAILYQRNVLEISKHFKFADFIKSDEDRLNSLYSKVSNSPL